MHRWYGRYAFRRVVHGLSSWYISEQHDIVAFWCAISTEQHKLARFVMGEGKMVPLAAALFCIMMRRMAGACAHPRTVGFVQVASHTTSSISQASVHSLATTSKYVRATACSFSLRRQCPDKTFGHFKCRSDRIPGKQRQIKVLGKHRRRAIDDQGIGVYLANKTNVISIRSIQ
jgi:hypothetical protein